MKPIKLFLLLLLFCLKTEHGYSNTDFSISQWGKNTFLRVYNGGGFDWEKNYVDIVEQVIDQFGGDSLAVYISLGYIHTITLADTLPDYFISVDTVSFNVFKDTIIDGKLRQERGNGMHQNRNAICIYTASNELDFTSVLKLVYYGLMHVNEIRSTQKEISIDPLGANAILHTVDTNTIDEILAANPPELNRLLNRKFYLYPTPFSYNNTKVDMGEVSIACYYAYPQFFIFKPNKKTEISGEFWLWDKSKADTAGRIIAAFTSISGILTISRNKQIICAGKNSIYFLEGEKVFGPYYWTTKDIYGNECFIVDFEDLGNTTRLYVNSDGSGYFNAYYNRSMHRVVAVDSSFINYYQEQKAMRENLEKKYKPKHHEKPFIITGFIMLALSLIPAILIATAINRNTA